MTSRLLAFVAILAVIQSKAAYAQSNFESSKMSPGAVVQGSALKSSKVSTAVVVSGSALQSSKLSTGMVLSRVALQSSKMSIGLVLQTQSRPPGIVTRAPLTHF